MMIKVSSNIQHSTGGRSGGYTNAPTNDIYFYKSYWDLLTNVVSPIFVTAVRGMVARNTAESCQLSIVNKRNRLTLESATHYTYMNDPTRPKIAITDFKNDIQEADLPSFSFLVANKIHAGLGKAGSIVAGAVHPAGYPLSSLTQKAKFEISVENSDTPNHVTVFLRDVSDYENINLLVSPLWFPDAGALYPRHVGDITVAASSCIELESDAGWKCGVFVGTAGNLVAPTHLGFSFLAVGDKKYVTTETPSAAPSVGDGLPIPPSANETTYHEHGQVVMSGYAVDHTASKLSNGVQARASFSDNTQSFTVHGGEGASSCIGLIGGRSHYPPHCYLNCY